jgi:hypothetical protein
MSIDPSKLKRSIEIEIVMKVPGIE